MRLDMDALTSYRNSNLNQSIDSFENYLEGYRQQLQINRIVNSCRESSSNYPTFLNTNSEEDLRDLINEEEFYRTLVYDNKEVFHHSENTNLDEIKLKLINDIKEAKSKSQLMDFIIKVYNDGLLYK